MSTFKWPMLCCFMHHKYTGQVEATGLKRNKRDHNNKYEQGVDNFPWDISVKKGLYSGDV